MKFFGGRARELAMRLTDRLATVTTTNSALARDSLARRRIAPSDRLLVVPNGLAVEVFTAASAHRGLGARRAGRCR